MAAESRTDGPAVKPPAAAGDAPRLARQLAFVLEIDRLKQILRRTTLIDGSRRENSAEHSWHLALMAMILAEHADQPVNIGRVVRMLLVHDLVEIDAGDTFVYDEAANLDKAEREAKAAERIFGLLPGEQAQEMRALWQEFEARITPDATFAAALDRLQPLLHNYHTQGAAWRANGVTFDEVMARNRHIADGSQTLWRYIAGLIEEAAQLGYLPGRPL